MNQNIWGKHAWFFLHTLTLGYSINPTSEDKRNMLNYLTGLSNVLPCSVCKGHFRRNLYENPPRLENRLNFFKWMVDVHNEVNGRTGKRTWTYSDVLKKYEDEYNTELKLTESGGVLDLSPLTSFIMEYRIHIIYWLLMVFLILVLKRR